MRVHMISAYFVKRNTADKPVIFKILTMVSSALRKQLIFGSYFLYRYIIFNFVYKVTYMLVLRQKFKKKENLNQNSK